MKSQKELHEWLDAMLKKAEKELEKTKRDIEEEKKRSFLAKERLYNLEKAHIEETYGFDFNKIEDSLLESVYKIINP